MGNDSQMISLSSYFQFDGFFLPFIIANVNLPSATVKSAYVLILSIKAQNSQKHCLVEI